MMKRLVILGGPGDGAIVAAAALAAARAGAPYAVAGYLNDSIARSEVIHGLPVLGRFEEWSTLESDTIFIPSIHKVGQMPARAARVKSLGIPCERWGSVLHPQSFVAPDATLGCGVFVASFATVQPGSRIGDFVCIRSGAHISHDTIIGDFAFIGPNASLAGRTSVDEGGHIGSNASIREHLTVGAFAIVGLGAVVTKPVDANCIVAGNPARPLPSDEVADPSA
jgi:acetyltransferase EpsM